MIEVSEDIQLTVDVDSAWSTAGNFEGLHVWHPVVERTEMRSDGGVPQRVLHLDGGGALVENYDSDRSDPTTCAWTLVSGPFPVKNYRAQVSVEQAGEGAKVTWSAAFDADGVSDQEAKEMIAGAFRAGLNQLPNVLA